MLNRIDGTTVRLKDLGPEGFNVHGLIQPVLEDCVALGPNPEPEQLVRWVDILPCGVHRDVAEAFLKAFQEDQWYVDSQGTLETKLEKVVA